MIGFWRIRKKLRDVTLGSWTAKEEKGRKKNE
jgi:hypothetical protein